MSLTVWLFEIRTRKILIRQRDLNLHWAHICLFSNVAAKMHSVMSWQWKPISDCALPTHWSLLNILTNSERRPEWSTLANSHLVFPLLISTINMKLWLGTICFHVSRFRITKTYLYNSDPLKPHFYIVKLGFTGVYSIFFLLKNIDCGYSLEPPHRGGSNEYPQSMFWAEILNISEFFIWKFSVFGVEIFYIFE